MTDALNTENAIAFVYPAFVTQLATTFGNALQGKGEQPEGSVEPLPINGLDIGLTTRSVTRSAGGQTLDSAQLEWAVVGHLENRTQPANFSQEVQVFADDSTTPTDRTRLLWSDYVTEVEKVGRGKETLTAEAQLRPYHFGRPFPGQTVLAVFAGSDETHIVDMEPVFNPNIRGKIYGNRSDMKLPAGATEPYLFIHPQSVQSAAAETWGGQTAERWALAEAVHRMCVSCNPDEIYLRNPSLDDLATLAVAPDLVDKKLPTGKYLPAYLDALLQPYGFNWWVDPSDQLQLPIIRLYSKGFGTEKTIKLQAAGFQLELSASDATEYQVARRIGDAPNAVTVKGALLEREVTLPLYPAWTADKDNLERDDLDKTDGASYAANPNVHRLWVANEGADYDGLRTDDHAAVVPDLRDVFPEDAKYDVHRRIPDEPLAYRAANDKTRAPFLVEYKKDSATGWVPLKDEVAGNFIMLPDQIGVVFNSDKPPEELVDNVATAKLRITCTIEGDSRVRGVADRQETAVNARENRLVLRVDKQFVDRQVATTGDYASVLAGSDADEQDDTTAIQTFAEDLRDQHEIAENACNFVLFGHHLDYEIGDLITEVEGRSVSLNQASADATAVYPQITSITYDRTGTEPYTVIRCDRGTRPAGGRRA